MSTQNLFDPKPLISPKTWARIKSGAAVAGPAIGTIAICAASTLACAYAQGFGYMRGTRDGRLGMGSGSDGSRSSDRDYGGTTVPLSGGFRRSVFDRDEAA